MRTLEIKLINLEKLTEMEEMDLFLNTKNNKIIRSKLFELFEEAEAAHETETKKVNNLIKIYNYIINNKNISNNNIDIFKLLFIKFFNKNNNNLDYFLKNIINNKNSLNLILSTFKFNNKDLNNIILNYFIKLQHAQKEGLNQFNKLYKLIFNLDFIKNSETAAKLNLYISDKNNIIFKEKGISFVFNIEENGKIKKNYIILQDLTTVKKYEEGEFEEIKEKEEKILKEETKELDDYLNKF